MTSSNVYGRRATNALTITGLLLLSFGVSLLVMFVPGGFEAVVSPPGIVVLAFTCAGLSLFMIGRIRDKATSYSRLVRIAPYATVVAFIAAFRYALIIAGFDYSPLFMRESYPEGIIGCWALFDAKGRRADDAFYASPAATRLDTTRHRYSGGRAGVQRIALELDSANPPGNVRQDMYDPEMAGRWGISSVFGRVHMSFGFLSTTNFVFKYPSGANVDTLFGRAAMIPDYGPWVEPKGKAYAVRVSCERAPIPKARPATVRAVIVVPAERTMRVGDSAVFNSAVDADAGMAITVTWKTTDSSAVLVDRTGAVRVLAIPPRRDVFVCATSTVNTGVTGCAVIRIMEK